MEKFIDYWQHIPSAHRMLFLLGGMVLFWLIEGYYPLFRFSYKRYRHARMNLVLLGTTVVLNLLLGIFTIRICDWVTTQHIGIINWLQLPTWAAIVVGLMFGDLFGQYIPHRIMHRVKWMWKFHMVHHSDTHVDVTTGTRHHPGEWIFREFFMIIGILVVGIPVWLYFLYRSCSAFFTYFNHANIQVPRWLDKPISLFFVSPNMHKVHHHYVRPLTDTNYSNIFSVWDRLFGTFAYEDVSTLRYGLDVLDDADDEKLTYQLKIPFNNSIKTDY
jgi:sterol desaturase/sphingolipid hydroxylase (fatty acid hydroxylase superfamily)